MKNRELTIPFKEDLEQLTKFAFAFQKEPSIENLRNILKFVYPSIEDKELYTNYEKVLCGVLTKKITEMYIFHFKNKPEKLYGGYYLDNKIYYVEVPMLNYSYKSIPLQEVILQEIVIIKKAEI